MLDDCVKSCNFAVTCMLAIGAASAVPVPDNFLPQRVESAVQGPVAQGAEGRIVFIAGNSDATFNVYSITGQQIKVVRVSADQTASVDFPKGCYIVRCGNQWSRKVVVR